jgi:nitroreductase
MNDLPSASIEARRAADEASATRRSIRALLPTPVPEATIRDILDVAACAALVMADPGPIADRLTTARATVGEFTGFHS